MLWPIFELIGITVWILLQFFFSKKKRSIQELYKSKYNQDEIINGYSNETIYRIIGLTLFIIFVSIVYLKESLF